ncbi:MAG: helix-turn-helix domain-containing protein [Clostridia bacterium]|nr:helix-turn-helix domain-containing protein [Clostridia bacterium]
MNNNKNIETAVKENDVPIWEKNSLTLEEAAAYSGIGRNKLRELSQQKNCPFAVWLGGKLYIVREKLDDFTDKQFKI